MKSTCWDTRATDSIIKSGQKDTEASIHNYSPAVITFTSGGINTACLSSQSVNLLINSVSNVKLQSTSRC